MNILPNKLIQLDDKLQHIGCIPRVNAVAAIDSQTLAEGHYDKFIVAHKEIIADALREALILAEDSTLLYLGKTLSIDALFAEVEGEARTFKRFVIVEDKLFRNQEARREVLGQILDYAKSLHETDLDRLCQLLAVEHRVWLDTNDYLITQALHDSNFLLLICGDRIQPRLVDYVKHLRKQLSPLISVDLALVSLALFSDGRQHILIPYVVALVTAEEGISIKVVVQNTEGDLIPASVTLTEDTNSRKERGQKIAIDALLEAIRIARGNEAVEIAQTLFDHAGELGAELKPAEASCSVRVKDADSGNYSTVFVVTKHGTFYIGWQERWTPNAGIDPEVALNYERRLTDILGKSPTYALRKGESAISLTEIGNHLEPVLSEIRTAVKALRHGDKQS